MEEAKLYELLGRKQAQIEEILANYRSVLGVLKAVKDGTIHLDRVSINGDALIVREADATKSVAEQT